MKPELIIPVDYPAVSNEIDLLPRVQKGIELAKANGFDLCFIVENDDFYPSDYFERFGDMAKHQFFGQDHSWYYNLRNKTYKNFEHLGRSSLFTTGLRISALERFKWPHENTQFLDIKLWEYAQDYKCKFVDTNAIGIKHGIGLCGGKGHRMTFENRDEDMNWLKKRVDAEAFEFYSNLNVPA